MKKREAAGETRDADGPTQPHKKLKTEEMNPPAAQSEVMDSSGWRGDTSKMFSCSLCQYHTPDEKQIMRHFDSSQHKEVLKYLSILFPQREVDFLHKYFLFKKREMSMQQKNSNLQPINDEFQGIGQEHCLHRIQAAYCRACGVLIPDVPGLLTGHIKSDAHGLNCKATFKKIKTNSYAVAKELLLDEKVLKLKKKYTKVNSTDQVLVAEEDDDDTSDEDDIFYAKDDPWIPVNHNEDTIADMKVDAEVPVTHKEGPANENKGHPTSSSTRVQNDLQLAPNCDLKENAVLKNVHKKQGEGNKHPVLHQNQEDKKKVPDAPKNPEQKKMSRKQRKRARREWLQNPQGISQSQSSGGDILYGFLHGLSLHYQAAAKKQQVINQPQSSGAAAKKQQVINQPQSSGAAAKKQQVINQPQSSGGSAVQGNGSQKISIFKAAAKKQQVINQPQSSGAAAKKQQVINQPQSSGVPDAPKNPEQKKTKKMSSNQRKKLKAVHESLQNQQGISQSQSSGVPCAAKNPQKQPIKRGAPKEGKLQKLKAELESLQKQQVINQQQSSRGHPSSNVTRPPMNISENKPNFNVAKPSPHFPTYNSTRVQNDFQFAENFDLEEKTFLIGSFGLKKQASCTASESKEKSCSREATEPTTHQSAA